MNKYFYVIILAMLASVEAEAQAVAKVEDKAPKPRLVVNIVVDQLCNDNLEEFMSLYGNDGWKKILAEGTVFSNAQMPFLPIDCASATAALSSGSYPFYNGIPSEEWVSRKTTLLMGCTSDQTSLLSPRGSSPAPVNMLASALGDELKIATERRAKVYSVAVESEAAVFLAGHCADGVYWLDTNSGKWTASAYYAEEPQWLRYFNERNVPARKLKNSGRQFAGDMKYLDYKRSPEVNADVTDFALQCFAETLLGSDDDTDMLNVQYYAGTPYQGGKIDAKAGVRETYVALDMALGRLIKGIESRVGKDKVLFTVTSTGYREEVPVEYKEFNVPSGTVYINRTSNLLNMYLSAIYGQAHYVEGYRENQIYLDRKAIERRKLRLTEVLERCEEMLLMSDGIRDVHTLFSLTAAADNTSQKLRNGMSTDVSGDIILDIYPGWKIVNEDNSRVYTSRQYGFCFPIVFYGNGVRKETVATGVTADRVAPTISKAIRIRAPNACKAEPLM